MFKKLLVAASLQAKVVLDSDGKEVRTSDVIERATPMIGAFV